MRDFGPRAAHARFHHFGAVGCATGKATVKFLHRRRQDENADNVTTGLLIQLLRALPVNVEQHIATARQDRINRRVRRAITVAKDMRPFKKLTRRDHRAEAFEIDEMIILAINLAGPHRARGRRNRHFEASVRRK